MKFKRIATTTLILLLAIPIGAVSDNDNETVLRRSGFKEISERDETDPDTGLVEVEDGYFAKIANGNYNDGNLTDKKEIKGVGKESGEEVVKNAKPSATNVDKKPATESGKNYNIDEIKKKGSLGNPVSTHIDGYGQNAAIFYSVGSSKTIVIDPGHQKVASSDMSSGASSDRTGTPEYAIVQKYGLELRDLLLGNGYNVVMVRITNDAVISNKSRSQLAVDTKADFYISLHCNGVANVEAHGIENCFGRTDDPVHYPQARAFGDCFIEKLAAKKTGMPVHNADYALNGYNIFSKNKVCPAILIEVGYINHHPASQQDCKLVESASYQTAFCKAVLEALQEKCPV